MAIESKPLFHPEVLRQQVRSFSLPEQAGDWQPKLQHWAGLISSGRADQFKETALLPDFLTDIFGGLLGYTGPAAQTGSPCCFHPHHRTRPRPRCRNPVAGAHPRRPRQPGLRPDPSGD